MRAKVVLLVSVLAVALPSWAQRKVDETRPLAADGVVAIENIAGSVQVVGWSESRVVITCELGSDVEDLVISGDERRLQVEVKVPDRGGDLDNEAELVIRMPAAASLEVETVSASIEVGGVAGALELESVSGSVEVSDRPLRLSAETVSGEITIAFAPQRSELETVSGSITVADGEGDLDADTVSGSIEISGGQYQGCNFETVSGSITFEAGMASDAELEFESMSGSISLLLPASISAEFDITTFSGDIDNAIGPEATSTSKHTPEKELSFTAGGGGARVSISSFSGNVELKKR